MGAQGSPRHFHLAHRRDLSHEELTNRNWIEIVMSILSWTNRNQWGANTFWALKKATMADFSSTRVPFSSIFHGEQCPTLEAWTSNSCSLRGSRGFFGWNDDQEYFGTVAVGSMEIPCWFMVEKHGGIPEAGLNPRKGEKAIQLIDIVGMAQPPAVSNRAVFPMPLLIL